MAGLPIKKCPFAELSESEISALMERQDGGQGKEQAGPITRLPPDLITYITKIIASTGDPLKQEPARDSISWGRTHAYAHSVTHEGIAGEAIRLAPLEDDALGKIWNRISHNFSFKNRKPQTIHEIKQWLVDPSNAEQIGKVTILNLPNCGLQAIPPHIAVFTNLQKLNPSDNQI